MQLIRKNVSKARVYGLQHLFTVKAFLQNENIELLGSI